MKLSPEAKQVIKTAIEQLRLLLVDDAMGTVSKHWMDDSKSDCHCQIAHTGNCESNRQVVLEAHKVEVSGNNPFEEIQAEIKQLKAQVELISIQLKKRPDEEALDGVNLKRIKETFLQVAGDVIAKEKI